jgi:uncharacterized oligopeptide transporter (OPT) family protein
VVGNEVSAAFRVGSGGTLFGASLSLALIGVGHLVGVTVGVAMLVGLLISYGSCCPRSRGATCRAAPTCPTSCPSTFGHEVRFAGAGAIAVAAVWTLLKILGRSCAASGPAAVSSAARRGGGTGRAHRAGPADRHRRRDDRGVVDPDRRAAVGLPVRHAARRRHGLDDRVSLVYIVVIGAVIAAVAGLHGRAHRLVQQPDLRGGHPRRAGHRPAAGGDARIKRRPGQRPPALVAYALFTTAVVFSVATISNDNLQDLKTGQLVGATPWKQQVALVIGVIFGALVIAPVLDLLNTAFGFAGAPGAGENALARTPGRTDLGAGRGSCSGAT